MEYVTNNILAGVILATWGIIYIYTYIYIYNLTKSVIHLREISWFEYVWLVRWYIYICMYIYKYIYIIYNVYIYIHIISPQITCWIPSRTWPPHFLDNTFWYIPRRWSFPSNNVGTVVAPVSEEIFLRWEVYVFSNMFNGFTLL